MLASLLLPTSLVSAAGRNPNAGIAPINSTTYGYSYGEWGAKWWQWALSIPAASNPLLDPTGANAAVSQSGPVFFLAGTFGESVSRAVEIPAGKALFFPIVNAFWGSTCVGEPRTRDGIRPLVAPQIDATTVSAEIDGVPVQNLGNYRAESPLFCLDVALDLFGISDPSEFCAPGQFIPNCTADLPNPEEHFGPTVGIGPCMADGVWLLIAPLKPGQHTIHFAASRSDFSLDVIYHLTVK